MDSNYVFLCGVMWCGYGEQEAGKELLRATSSLDPDTRALAWAMLTQGMDELRKKVIGNPGEERVVETHLREPLPAMGSTFSGVAECVPKPWDFFA
jgi:hypothetical protein